MHGTTGAHGTRRSCSRPRSRRGIDKFLNFQERSRPYPPDDPNAGKRRRSSARVRAPNEARRGRVSAYRPTFFVQRNISRSSRKLWETAFSRIDRLMQALSVQLFVKFVKLRNFRPTSDGTLHFSHIPAGCDVKILFIGTLFLHNFVTLTLYQSND